MKVKKTYITNVLAIVFMALLIIPFVQSRFSLLNIGKLEGAFIPKTKPDFSVKSWFNGQYQEKAEEYINESFGFRNIFVRLNNQIAFSFFKKANADNIVVGKNNFLYQRPTINAYYGRDYMGNQRIEERVKQLKFISDTLSRLNKDLIVVFGTGKGSFFPDYIPDKLKSEKRHSNLENHLECVNKYGLHYIDFNSYFIAQKSNSFYPLYPQYGIHWSRYGGYLVTDSLIHYIEKLRNINLPDIIVDSIEIRQAENEDYDIAGGMNLLFRLKSFDMAYPIIHYEPDSGKAKPSMLVIGDSFYWGLQNMDITMAFSKIDFWFYNKRGTAGALKELTAATKISMAKEITNYDIIILLCTEANLPDLGWGFIESTYLYYKGIDMDNFHEILFRDELQAFKERAKRNPARMEQITEMAKRENITVDSMLTLQASIRIKNKQGRNKTRKTN